MDYLFYATGNPLPAECDHETGFEWLTTKGGHLEFAPQKPERKPHQPRKPKSRVFVSDLPLQNCPTPACPHIKPVAEAAQPATMPGLSSSTVGPAALTPAQVKTLETAERLGIVNADGQANLEAWRTRQHNKRLRQFAKQPSRLAKIRRWLSPSMEVR